MLGLFYVGTMIVTSICSGAKAAYENYQCRRKGEELNKSTGSVLNTYYDRRGHQRELSTGNSVYIDHINRESAGQDVYMYNGQGVPIRNLSEERRTNSYNQAVQNRDSTKSVCEWKKGCPAMTAGLNGTPYYSGIQYRDLDNGRVYVCRGFNLYKDIGVRAYARFYMDVNSGYLVREADSDKYERAHDRHKADPEAYEKFITLFNDKQSKEGYLRHSNVPDNTESEFAKRIRMQNYYCNSNEVADIPT